MSRKTYDKLNQINGMFNVLEQQRGNENSGGESFVLAAFLYT